MSSSTSTHSVKHKPDTRVYLSDHHINDLVLYLKSFHKGIKCGEDSLCISTYADDIGLLAETEQDLPVINWYATNEMTVNSNKSIIVQFRNPSVRKTDFDFRCGNDILNIVDKYIYLGISLTENLDYELTAKFVAQMQVVIWIACFQDASYM